MFKFLIISLILYLAFKLIRGFFKGVFVIKQIKAQQNETGQSEQNPFLNRANSAREKDISDRARILDEEKNAE